MDEGSFGGRVGPSEVAADVLVGGDVLGEGEVLDAAAQLAVSGGEVKELLNDGVAGRRMDGDAGVGHVR